MSTSDEVIARSRILRCFILAAALVFAPAASAHSYELGQLHIGHPTAAPTAPGQPNGAAYLTIENSGAEGDKLIAMDTPVAGAAEAHDMLISGGVMSMRKLDAIEIAPGAPIVFQPGGMHIMLIGLKSPLKIGETVPLTLVFEKAGKITVDLAIEKASEHEGHGDHMN